MQPAQDMRPGPRQGRVDSPSLPPTRLAPGQRWDGRHGQARAYPDFGRSARQLPPRAIAPLRGAPGYRFAQGVWYAPGPGGFVVVRPPVGLVIPVLPPFRTIVRVGPLVYYYVNDVYYRQIDGGYEVVLPPGDEPASAMAQRNYVYPGQGQGSREHADDEYACHRWAVEQTGTDPTRAAGARAAQRASYERARSACLEGRGYTVR
ncbi:MAG: DUF6515 family protein [Burkholderiaceae bacterium]